MVTTRKSRKIDEPVSAEESADVDSVSVDDLPRRMRQVRTGSPSTSSTDDVRVWPLCFAIAIEKSQRVRPNVMVGASSLLAGLTYHLQQSDAEPQYSTWILSPLAVFILVEAATLSAAFFILLPQTMAQAYRDDKTSAFKVADSAVLSALPPAVARFAVGSGIAWRRVALAVVRDGALFMTLYLLCISKLFGGEDDVNLELSVGIGESDTGEGWQEMDGGISVHSYTITAEDD